MTVARYFINMLVGIGLATSRFEPIIAIIVLLGILIYHGFNGGPSQIQVMDTTEETQNYHREQINGHLKCAEIWKRAIVGEYPDMMVKMRRLNDNASAVIVDQNSQKKISDFCTADIPNVKYEVTWEKVIRY